MITDGNTLINTTNPGIDDNERQRGQITLNAANKLNLKSATSMNFTTDNDGLNISCSGVELTDNDLAQTTATGSIFNLTVAGAANETISGNYVGTIGGTYTETISGVS